jgi:hypothetical protein
VGAAVDHVEVRDRQPSRNPNVLAQVAVQRLASLVGQGTGDRLGDGQQRVGAESGLVGGAVELDQGPVQLGQVGEGAAGDGLGDVGLDRLAGAGHAQAPVAGGVAVASFDGLVLAG